MENNNKEMESSLIIDNSNFSQYFFDVRKFGPKHGQIMSKFSAIAVFGEGPEKRDIIKVLRKDKAEAAAMVMRKIHCAKEPDCYTVCREICEDLISGMSENAVAKKNMNLLLKLFITPIVNMFLKETHIGKLLISLNMTKIAKHLKLILKFQNQLSKTFKVDI